MTPEIAVHFQPGARELALRLFGRIVHEQDLTQAVGALPGAAVTFAAERGQLIATVEHEWVAIQVRRIFRDETGAIVIRNRALRKSPDAPAGFEIKMFQTQVEAAQKLGIKKLTTFAAGYLNDPQRQNGYYTWPRFGFDAPLDEDEQDFLQEEQLPFSGAQTLNELFSAGGKDWWKTNGYEKEMVFDLAPNSSMIQMLNEYVRELQQAGKL